MNFVDCPQCGRNFRRQGMSGHMRKCKVTPLELLWTKVNKNGAGGCWLWTSYKNEKGYGLMTLPGGGKNIRAHRYLYEQLVGPIPDGKFLLHKCDIPACVNPEHLYAGSFRENTIDFLMRNRHPTQTRIEDVLRIRQLLATHTVSEVSKITGKSYSLVRNIHVRKRYSYLPSSPPEQP